MDKGLISAMLFLVLSILRLSIPVCAESADPLYIYCSDQNSTLNSRYGNNLMLLLESLPSNTSSHNGFYSTYVGNNLSRVNGRALCRGDITSMACQNCVENASQVIMNECRKNEAIIWYELCQVHYSIFPIFLPVYTGKYPTWNLLEESVSDRNRLSDVVTDLMGKLSGEAAFNTSQNMFATGEESFSKTQKIYGLVQCTRDINQTYCKSCLESALGDLGGCCFSRQGGMVLSRNCNVRFEMYRFFNSSSPNLDPKGSSWKLWKILVAICVPIIVFTVLMGSCALCIGRKKGTIREEERSQRSLLRSLASPASVSIAQEGNIVSSEELPFMDLAIIKAATDNFSNLNKLGQGGFGIVYKGVLPDGKEIAVKRLAKKSWQGLDEFKNEVILIAKLQHRNLVSLLGCSLDEEEKLLIYEFMPNKSLDLFIFDSANRSPLDWETRYNIICGIARGLLYLHEDSRLKIIHRDLKPNNVLLDGEMVAKISDFGLARIFGENQNTANTKRVAGTYGYMAPEYAMEGLFSVKSDVFSFGVILLEIISGKRNSGFYLTGHAQTLLAYAWRLWNKGEELEFIDPSMTEVCPIGDVVRCIRIGLLCVQEDPADRPTMSSVVVLLGSDSIALPEPRQPAFSVGRALHIEQSSSSNPSVNVATVSSVTRLITN